MAVTLVAIDPGRKTGWAQFTDGVLAAAGVIVMPPLKECRSESILDLPVADLALIEMPRWYPNERKIDVNDLLDLAVLVGEIKESYEFHEAKVELVWPRTWKGTVPKKVMLKRIYDVLSARETQELPRRKRGGVGVFGFDPNMIDACGLGLWKVGRL